MHTIVGLCLFCRLKAKTGDTLRGAGAAPWYYCYRSNTRAHAWIEDLLVVMRHTRSVAALFV